MQSGKLRKRITIQTLPAKPATDSMNAPTFSDWTTFATSWASIEPLSGKELWFAVQTSPEVTHKVVMRYQAGITSKMQVLYHDPKTNANRVFQIEAVTDTEEQNRTLTLMCKEAQ